MYFDKVIAKNPADSVLAGSCVQDSKTGDIILKLVNYDSASARTIKVDLSKFKKIIPDAEKTVVAGDANAENTLAIRDNILPAVSSFTVSKKFEYTAPPMSLTVIRIKTE